jgi:AraC-like DNA-binding protein
MTVRDRDAPSITGRPPLQEAVIWRPANLDRVEALRARYTHQEFLPHRHEGFLLGVIEEGAHAVWCRGRRTVAGPGTVATMDPEEVHHGGAAAEAGWSQRMLYVPRSLVAEVLEDALDRPLPPGALHFRDCFRREPVLALAFQRLHRALEFDGERLGREVLFESVVARLFARFATGPAPPEPRTDGRNLERAREFLHAHLREPCSLGALARLAGLRRRRFVEAFRLRFGLPPHRYLTQLRIDAARRLLASGAPLREVASDLGFADQSHFARHFKAILGVTPARYLAAS